MARAFDSIVREMKRLYQLRVRRWRRQMSGAAWQVRYGDGRVINWIEAPRPRTPISLAVFLHEVGHHAIGFDRDWARCVEEHHAWQWALRTMRRYGVEPDERVLRRVKLSMQYAVASAMRAGLRQFPQSLAPYLPHAA